MTQAFNLAQLANNLNTSGQLDATDGLNGLVANANLASSGSPSSSTYLRGDRTWASISTGKILQAVTSTKITGQVISGATTVDISGLSVSITPSSSSSRILVLWYINYSDTGHSNIILYRGATKIAVGTQVGNRIGATHELYTTDGGGDGQACVAGSWIDSPATTSSTTYKFQCTTYNVTTQINQTNPSLDRPENPQCASSITVLEIAP